MKILFIAPIPPPISGHSLASKVLLDELDKIHHVVLVNLSKNSFKHGVNSFGRIIEVANILKAVCRNKKNADVIYLTISESVAGNIKDILIYLLCLKNLSKVIIHLHGGSLRKLLFDRNLFLFTINKYFLRRLGGAVVLGESLVNIFSDIMDGEKIHIIPNFAEDYLFLSEKEIIDKFTYTEPLRILFLSNLIEGKGHDKLLEAYLSLNDNIRNRVIIDYAGAFESDNQKNAFLNKIAGIAGVCYRGIVERDQKKDLLSSAHILCLPTSLNEGQPISILEAYASGCAVMTTNLGGITDIFKDKVNGFEIQNKSAKSIASIIEQLIDKTEDLLRIAILNRKSAYDKYRTSIYNSSLVRIIEDMNPGSSN